MTEKNEKNPKGPAKKKADKAGKKTAKHADAKQSATAQTSEAGQMSQGQMPQGQMSQGQMPEGQIDLSQLMGGPPKPSMFRRVLMFIFNPLSYLLGPFRRPVIRFFKTYYGPLPMQFGPAPIDHGAPDFESEEPSMLSGQIIFVLITSFFIIAFIWAYNAEIDEQVRAEGSVIPPSDVQIIQARLPGLVTHIGTSLGADVAKGDVLFRMEDEDVQADFDNNLILIHTARAAIARLEAEIKGAPLVSFPADLQQQALLAVAEEQTLFDQRRRAHLAEIDVLEQKIDTLEKSIEEKQAAARIARDRAAIQPEEYDIIKPLVDAEHEPRIKLIDAQSRWHQSRGEAELAELSIVSMQSDLATRHKERASLDGRYQAEAAARLVETQTRLSQAEARQASLAGKVGYAEVIAPMNGVISAIHLKTEGAVVQQGTVLAELVPRSTKATIRARLLPQDVADVFVGQPVKISLSAYDVSRYGSLEGVVTHIASNTTEQDAMPPFYETLIEIPEIRFSRAELVPEMVPGMQVTVDILGGKRTVMDYILSPIQKATSAAFREK